MAQKITGAQVDWDPGAPLIDVDTAIEDLAEDLSRSGRRRQLIALQHLCHVARRWGEDPPWHVYDGSVGEGHAPNTERQIASINAATRVIVLEPQNSEETTKEPVEPPEGIR